MVSVTPRLRAIGFAAVVSVFLLAIGGTLVTMSGGPSSESSRVTAHQVVADHDVVVSARPVADRTPLDLRSLHTKLLFLAWIGVLLAAASVARTAGRTIELRTRRAGSPPATRRRFDRGPPALASS